MLDKTNRSMLQRDIIIFGPPGNGKTTFLHKLAYAMKENFGHRIAYLGPDVRPFEAFGDSSSFHSTAFLNKRYEISRCIRPGGKEYECQKAIEVVSEKCSMEKIDFVFVDDIDLNIQYLKAIESIPARKVMTSFEPCSTDLGLFDADGRDCYRLEAKFAARVGFTGGYEYLIEGQKFDEFISSYIREHKINSILR